LVLNVIQIRFGALAGLLAGCGWLAGCDWLAGWPWPAAWLAGCLAVAGLKSLKFLRLFNKNAQSHRSCYSKSVEMILLF